MTTEDGYGSEGGAWRSSCCGRPLPPPGCRCLDLVAVAIVVVRVSSLLSDTCMSVLRSVKSMRCFTVRKVAVFFPPVESSALRTGWELREGDAVPPCVPCALNGGFNEICDFH